MANADNLPNGESEEAPRILGGERSLVIWFGVIMVVNVLSMLWLSVRADSPAYLRNILDFFLYSLVGTVTAYFAFRALFLFPMRMPDLFVIVLLLSLELKIALDELARLSGLGLLSFRPNDPEHLGQVFQVWLLTGSVAIGGAALGLRNCHMLKIESTVGRALAVACGLLALPAAAGTVGLLVLGIFSFGSNQLNEALLLILLWFASMIVTGINLAYFIRTLTLKAEIGAQEKLP